MKNQKLYAEAQTLRGCLSGIRTVSGRRKRSQDENEDIFVFPDRFVGDEAIILSSKAFRNMAHKTQVTTGPINTLIRNRLTHVMEVVACSVVTSEMLGLNTSLARAIAIGHDIGHVPFAHQGEVFMAKAMGKPTFCHEVMSCVVAQKIERHGRGLNLTHETLEGMMCHSGATAKEDMTPEAWVVRYADKFAYIFHDYNDFGRMGYAIPLELQILMEEFGKNQRERTTTAISGLIIESAKTGKVRFDASELAVKFGKMRSLMYQIYPRVTQQDPSSLMEPVLEFLTDLKQGNPFMLLALMTDKDVIYLASQPVKNMEHLRQTAVFEILPYLESIGEVDLCDPSLDW